MLLVAAFERDRGAPHADDVAAEWRRFAEGKRTLVALASDAGRTVVVLGDPSRAAAAAARQSRIIAMICSGASAKQVAIEIGMGEPTVSKEVRDALQSLGLASYVALVDMLGPWAATARWPEKRPPQVRTSTLHVQGKTFAVIGFSSSEMPRHPSLTPAERAVAELVSRGFSNGAIARARRRSPRTIANQLARTFDKLGIHSRVELVIALGEHARRERTEPARNDQLARA